MRRFIYKVYDKNRNYIKTIGEDIVLSEPSFAQKINGGQAEMSVDLLMSWDEPEDWTDKFNFIIIFVIDDENPLGRILYTGYIADRIPRTSEDGEKVTLNLNGLVGLLTRSKYRDGSSFTVIHAAEDPAEIITAIIDHFQTKYPPSSGTEWVGYDEVIQQGLTIRAGSQITTFGTDVGYKFENLDWASCVDEVLKLSAAEWYWFIDAGGDTIFKEKSATADHVFTIGNNVQFIEPPDSIKEIVNSVTLVYDGGSVTVEDSASITAYGESANQYTDKNISDATSANLAANVILDNAKNPIIQAKLVINNRYDIESIRPGHTCKVRNYKKGSVVLDDNMLIVSTNYVNGEYIELELGGIRFDVAKETTSIAELTASKEIQKKGLGTGGVSNVSSVFGRSGEVAAATNDYTWTQINKATSSIADITTKSHTLLTDIGSNTHAQIDTHITTVNSHIADSSIHFAKASIDHNSITNTHNLTTDINHNNILNNHNLTTDIDHDTILNTHNLTTDIDHDTILNGIGGNKHIDWTNASDDISTTGSITATSTSRIGNHLLAGTNMEINQYGSGDRTAYFDLHSDDTYTDYGLRVIKNAGANGSALIDKRGTGDFTIRQREAGDIVFLTTLIERMRITASGNVGIGAINPARRHEVRGTVSTEFIATRITNSNTTNGRTISSEMALSDSVGTIKSSARMVSGGNLNISTSYLAFETLFSDFNITEKMRILGNGGVLIGTTIDAGFKFEVNGTARVGDRGAESTAQVVNVITYTGPIPAANTVPEGTLAFKRAVL